MFCRDGGLRRIKAAYLTDDQIIHLAALVAFLALIARSVAEPPSPTARAALAAFDGLCAISGLVLDRFTQTQRMILALLNIPPPWPEDTSEAGKPWHVIVRQTGPDK